MQFDTMFESVVDEKALAGVIDKMLIDYRFSVAEMEGVQGTIMVLKHFKELGARVLSGQQVATLQQVLTTQHHELESLRQRVREMEVAAAIPPPSLASSNGEPVAPIAIDCSDMAGVPAPDTE